MRSRFGRPKAMTPVNLRRLARGFHSVAKQAPFRIAFQVDFGGQNAPKIDEISSFQKSTKFRCQNAFENDIEKKALKSNLGIDLGFPKPLKWLQKAMLNEACFATLWNPRANRRNATGVGVCKASKGLRI